MPARDQRAYQEKWRKKNPERYRILSRKNALKRYGLTIEEYDEMWKRQNGLCAICHCPEIRIKNGKPQALSVDHNHRTGKNRGLLCEAHNQGLGKFGENETILRNAIEYLQKYNGVN